MLNTRNFKKSIANDGNLPLVHERNKTIQHDQLYKSKHQIDKEKIGRQYGKNFSLVNIKMKSQSINNVKLNKKIGTPQNPKSLSAISQASEERIPMYAGHKATIMSIQNQKGNIHHGGYTLSNEND